MRHSQAFTLAELLIALLLLGLISAFSIPKVLHGANTLQREAIFKEHISDLSAVIRVGRLTGELTESNFRSYLEEHYSMLKTCGHLTASDCFPQGGASEGGYVMVSGLNATGLEGSLSGGCDCLWWLVDWNGDKGPNTHGDDQLQLRIESTGSDAWRLKNNGSGSSTLLWNTIWGVD